MCIASDVPNLRSSLPAASPLHVRHGVPADRWMEEAPVASWNASKIFPTSIRYLEYAPLRHGGLRRKFSCPDLSELLCVKLGFQLYCRRIDVERSHAATSRGMFCSSLFTCSLSRHNSRALWTETLLSRCFFAGGKHSANSLEKGMVTSAS